MAAILRIKNPETGEFEDIKALVGPQGPKGDTPPLSNIAPSSLGTASPGTATNASREDHIHPMPTANDIGALPVDGTAEDSSKLNGQEASYYATEEEVSQLKDDVQDKTRINYLRVTLQSQTIGGVTFTNDDGKIILNGTQTYQFSVTIGTVLLKANKTYKLIGCKDGGWGTYSLRLNSSAGTLIAGDIGQGNTYTPNNDEICTLTIHIATASATFDNIVFKPMITTDLSATYDDFVSYDDSFVKGRDVTAKDSIGDAWVSGKTYAVGDYCINGNRLYKCKTAHTAGSAFEASYWDSVNVATEIASLKTKYISCAEIGANTNSHLEAAFQSCANAGVTTGFSDSGSEGHYSISRKYNGDFCGGYILNNGKMYLLKRYADGTWYMRPIFPE